MKHYELLFVIKPTLTEEEVNGRVEFVKDILTKNAAEIVKIDELGVKKLAYEIEKQERGYYFVVYFTAKPEIMDEVLRNLRLDETVLRFLNLKFEKKKEIAQWDKLVANAGKKSALKKEAAKTEAKEAPKTEEAPKVEVAETVKEDAPSEPSAE